MRVIKTFKILIVLTLLLGCSTYQLTQTDFTKQFNKSNTIKLRRIYCTNEKGEKVWLSLNNNPTLIIQEKNSDSQLDYDINKTKYSNDSVMTTRLDLKASKRTIPIKDISKFKIKAIFPVEFEYFDVDSLRTITQFKNDSLRLVCEKDLSAAIFLEQRTEDVPIKDSIFLFVGGCYNMTFKDKLQVKQSVIQKITNDSIYISNAFNVSVATSYKKQYKIYGYLIKDIDFISAFYRGGKLAFKLNSNDYKYKTVEINKVVYDCPCWYRFDEESGEISFYRNWLSFDGYIGIREKNGKIYW